MHTRVVHFKSWGSALRAYLINGTVSTSLQQLKVFSKHLIGHTATLPGSATSSTSGVLSSSATENPFYSASYQWTVRGGGSNWRVDDAVLGAVHDTVHQMWVRPLPGGTVTLAQSSVVLPGNFTAGMSNSTTATFYGANSLLVQNVPLPIDFYFFGLNVMNMTWVTSNAYLQFGVSPTPLLTTNFNNSVPLGPSILFGAEQRVLRRVWISGIEVQNGLTLCTMTLNYDSQPITSSFYLNYEFTFGFDSQYQYIEIRGGTEMMYEGLPGVWYFSDGATYNITLPTIAGRSSIVLQSDLLGTQWKLYKWSALARNMPPPPNPPPA